MPPGSNGSVRLIGGLIPEEGTVQVCVSAVWSSVCHLSWYYKDAFVVCRQLGYPATGKTWRSLLISISSVYLKKRNLMNLSAFLFSYNTTCL